MSTYYAFAARGKNAWWRYLATILLTLLLATLAAIVLMAGLRMLHLIPADFNGMVDPGHQPILFLGFTALSFGLLIAGLTLATAVVQGKRFGDLVGAWSWQNFGRGFAIWGLVTIAGSLLDFALASKGFSITVSQATVGLAIAAVLALTVQTFAEEFIFRGYFTQGFLLATKRPMRAAIAAGLLFGSLHIPNGYPSAVAATALGIVASLIAIRTGGIAFTFGLHLVNNLFGAVVVVSGDDVFKGLPAIITQQTPQLEWFDVGLEIVALALVAWFVLRRSRVAAEVPLGNAS